MIHLYVALYTEGKTDDLFLPALVERTARAIVLESKGEPVEVQPVFLVRPAKDAANGAEKILQAARMARNYDVLIVHQDADTQTYDDVKTTRLEPGKDLIAQTPRSEKVCRYVVPLVPVKMTEAWMLADLQALLEELNADIKPPSLRAELKTAGLTLPSKPHQVINVDNPKQMLEQIIRLASRRNITRNDLYEPLGESVRLEVLRKLDAYKRFEENLTAVLAALNKIKI